MSIATIYRDDMVIVSINGTPYQVDVDDPRYEDLCELLEDNNAGEEEIKELLTNAGRYQKILADGEHRGFDLDADPVTCNGIEIAMDLSRYLMASLDRNSGADNPVFHFIERLMENPSEITRERLFAFMEHNLLPITEEGRFLAYKVVGPDYYDKHSHTVEHRPGDSPPRKSWSDVDTSPDRTCSFGYHACAREYAVDQFYSPGDHVMCVSVAPEDVGSIPTDYNNAKLRCRGYIVVSEITESVLADPKFHKLHAVGGLNVDDEDRARLSPSLY